jgi:hypothetical protein
MAEHMNLEKPGKLSPFNNMGKPLSSKARQKAYDDCKRMRLDSADAWACVGAVAEQLERDRPYAAQGAAMRYLDLTGAYRLMAVLLTSGE